MFTFIFIHVVDEPYLLRLRSLTVHKALCKFMCCGSRISKFMHPHKLTLAGDWILSYSTENYVDPVLLHVYMIEILEHRR